MRHVTSALVLCALVGLPAGCSDSGGGDDQPSVDSLKQQARRAYQDRQASAPDKPLSNTDDPCAVNKWYGDGTCESWCPDGDKDDCTMADADGGVACAEFWSPADGKCDWTDPCGPTQDEDCQRDAGGLVCTLQYSLPDGKCDTSDPCSRVQDADCQKEPVACPAILYPVNGKCEAPPGCETSDADCTTPIACIEIAYPANGKCEAARGCEYTDPKDCLVACDAKGYAKDGVCSAPPGCEQNDPDCVVCIAIRYADNGKCEAAKGCEANDPVDCKQ